jgi:hypothetical protein
LPLRRYAAAALWNRAATYRLKGNLKQAEADYRAAVEREPDLGQSSAGLSNTMGR